MEPLGSPSYKILYSGPSFSRAIRSILALDRGRLSMVLSTTQANRLMRVKGKERVAKLAVLGYSHALSSMENRGSSRFRAYHGLTFQENRLRWSRRLSSGAAG